MGEKNSDKKTQKLFSNYYCSLRARQKLRLYERERAKEREWPRSSQTDYFPFHWYIQNKNRSSLVAYLRTQYVPPGNSVPHPKNCTLFSGKKKSIKSLLLSEKEDSYFRKSYWKSSKNKFRNTISEKGYKFFFPKKKTKKALEISENEYNPHPFIEMQTP